MPLELSYTTLSELLGFVIGSGPKALAVSAHQILAETGEIDTGDNCKTVTRTQNRSSAAFR